MKQVSMRFLILIFSVVLSGNIYAQSVYELSDLSEDDWLAMSTEERLTALGTSNAHAKNQTFIGDFGSDYDNYRKWGYDYYEMEDRYENYAFRGYQNYNILENNRRRWSYNEFGDRISKMGQNARIWSENWGGDGSFSASNGNNYINQVFQSGNDGVWVAKEGTNDWSIAAIGAQSLRTNYTPLTLSLPDVQGMRVDFQSANNSASILNSVVQGGTMLRAGQFRKKLGVLMLGATYANMYGYQGDREGGRDWYGTNSNYEETPLILGVRFTDDSPDDNEGGPIIYQVRLKINGRYRDDIIPTIILDDSQNEWITAISNPANDSYLRPVHVGGQGSGNVNHINLTLNETVPKYADYLFMNDYQKGRDLKFEGNFDTNVGSSLYQFVEQAGSPLQVNGTKYAVYLFDISQLEETIERAEVVTRVSNDYNIQTTMMYVSDVEGGHNVAANHTSWYKSTYWRTMAQANGNIKDGSNIATIDVDFGFQVATIVYGLDADMNYKGFSVKAEYVINSNHYMFPDGLAGSGEPSSPPAFQAPRSGHKWSLSDDAYYVTAEKSWETFGFAGEVFKMGKFYRPWLDVHGRKNAGRSTAGRNRTSRLPLIEDNDDDDMYPDTMTIQRIQGNSVGSWIDPDGTFPGNDLDNDGFPDTNKNLNEYADYDEDFLMFDSDQDEYVFGNDYNNNTIPDHREDDMKYDYPYDLDRQGYHMYFSYAPEKSVKLIVGSMRSKGVGLDTRNFNDYFKLSLDYNVFGIGKMFAEYRYEEIQDNVRDAYMQMKTSQRKDYQLDLSIWQSNRFERELYYDELEYKNSKVNRLYVESSIRAIPSLTIENHVKLERNAQVEGTMFDNTYQPNDVLNTIAVVNKFVYTKRFGNFEFNPGIKFRTFKKARSESLQPLRHSLTRIPLVMLKYHLSQQTQVIFGLQGIPGLALAFDDFVNEQNNYTKKDYSLQIQNRSDFFGYQIHVACGMEYEQFKYGEEYRKLENYKSTSTFVRINCGY